MSSMITFDLPHLSAEMTRHLSYTVLEPLAVHIHAYKKYAHTLYTLDKIPRFIIWNTRFYNIFAADIRLRNFEFKKKN